MAGSAQLRRLGAELRRLREEAGLTQGELGKRIGRTHATLVNWERGKTAISKSDLAYVLAKLRIPPAKRRELERLREDVGYGKGPWAIYGLPDWLRPLASFEEDAVLVATFDPAIIPGLLQTEAYARDIHVAGPHLVKPEDVDRWVAARMQRQKRLDGVNSLMLHAVIPEAALHLQIGGPSVLSRQLQTLLYKADKDNITIRVLPASAGAHAGLACNFTVLHFGDSVSYPPLGYFDGPLGGNVVYDSGQVADLINMFDDVRRSALDERDSVAMIEAVLKELHEKGS